MTNDTILLIFCDNLDRDTSDVKTAAVSSSLKRPESESHRYGSSSAIEIKSEFEDYATPGAFEKPPSKR